LRQLSNQVSLNHTWNDIVDTDYEPMYAQVKIFHYKTVTV